MRVNYKIVSDNFRDSFLPAYKTSGAAGMDLHACIDEALEISPMQRVRIPTGIALQLPTPQTVGLVYARSGLAWKHGVGLPNGVGVIDSDYTGEIQVLLVNFGENTVQISPGDRIAQIVFAPVHTVSLVQTPEFSKTERGSRGFGSTGVGAED
ncbi:dUTP diphosphatase [Alicyclobacillus sp. SO9]|nr:dUTP diphosphatase [Alicyclobacillus sp. SO9]